MQDNFIKFGLILPSLIMIPLIVLNNDEEIRISNYFFIF